MGSYRFKWPHSADDVIVTGTFDNWSKSIKLDNKGWVHEKTVEIPDTRDEILYKFIVNGQWRTDPSHATKRDHEGNENNVLDHDDIIPGAVGGAMLSSVGPGATTAGLAGAQPIEEKTKDLPGAFPETPGEKSLPSEGPLPTLQDRVVGVSPIPATPGAGNPVNLKPGEKVPDPSTLTNNTIGSTVTTDKESYERGAGGAAYSPVGKQDDAAAHFGRPAAGGTMIPESSLPMGTRDDVSSVGPGATTTGLAGQQPIEPRGTAQVVSKDADDNKDSGIAGKAAAGAAAAGVAAAGAAVAANEIVKNKTGKDPVSALPQSTQDTIKDNAKASDIPSKAGVERETAPNVPEEVKESQKEASAPPEAAANPEAVQDKSAAEKELLAKVPESNAQGEPAPTESAATATKVPTTTSASGAPQLGDPVGGGLAPITLPHDGTGPSATTGVAESSVPQTSTPQKRQSIVDKLKTKATPEPAATSSPAKSTPSSSAKKEKRRSFMQKLKEKLHV